jgi:hypothetical protein
MVNLFRGRKYPNGVYSIKDSVYPSTRKKEAVAEKKDDAPPSDSFGVLTSRGYVTISDKKDAYGLSQRPEMKTGSILGVKGFDGKFYIVTKEYLSKAQAAVNKSLKEDMDVQSIAEAAKLEIEGCRAVLRIMAENGEILEKKRGVFSPI